MVSSRVKLYLQEIQGHMMVYMPVIISVHCILYTVQCLLYSDVKNSASYKTFFNSFTVFLQCKCFSSYTENLRDGCWSPTRPSVFFTARQVYKEIVAGVLPSVFFTTRQVYKEIVAGVPPSVFFTVRQV